MLNNLKHNLAAVTSQSAMVNSCGRFVTITTTKKNGEIITRNGKLAQSPATHKNNPELFTLITPSYGPNFPKKFTTIDSRKVLRLAANKQILNFSDGDF